MTYSTRPSSQKGAALMVGLILLVVVTLVAVSAIRSTNMQQILATNMQERMVVYQTAESLIRQVVNTANSTAALPEGVVHILVQAINRALAGQDPLEIALEDPPAGLEGSAIFSFTGQAPAPGYSMGVGTSGVFTAYNYLVDATSTMPAANSQSNNRQGMRRIAPAP